MRLPYCSDKTSFEGFRLCFHEAPKLDTFPKELLCSPVVIGARVTRVQDFHGLARVFLRSFGLGFGSSVQDIQCRSWS